MGNRPNRRILFPLLLCVFVFSNVQLIFCAGQKEDNVKKAQSLFDEKEYNQALLLLAEVIKNEPDRFAEAVNLANRIREIKERYNEKYNDLIATLYTDQDVDKGLGIIAEMEALDPHPNPVTDESITNAKKAAELVANLNYFSKIMDDALSQIRTGDYSKALATYLTPFSGGEYDLHKQEFLSEGYGGIVEAAIEDAVAGIVQAAENAESLASEADKKLNALIDILETADEKTLSTDVKDLLDTLVSVNTAGDKADRIAPLFKNQADSVRNLREDAKGVLFLKYAYQLVRGRQANEGNEGIAFAIKSMSRDHADKAIARLDVVVDSRMSAGSSAYDTEKFADSGKSYKGASEAAKPLCELSYFFDKEERIAAETLAKLSTEWVVDSGLPRFMRAQEKLKTSLTYYDICAIRVTASRYSGITKAPTITETRNMVPEIRTLVTNISRIGSDWERYGKLASVVRGPSFNPDATENAIEACDAAAASIVSDYHKNMALVQAGIQTGLSQEKSFLASGITDTAYGVVFYPDRRKTALAALLENETFLGNSMTAVKSEWLSKTDVLFSQVRTPEALKALDALAGSVSGVLADIKDSIVKAETNITQAKKFKDLGDIRNREAQAELKKDNYLGARDRIREATDAYYQSLSFQEDADLRNNKLKSLIDLLAQIQKTENERVVREVRRLIEAAKSHYVKGDFDKAQDALNAALARWNDTQTEENAEIKDWLAYVRSALLIRSERVLSEKSPLYKDISQLYNLAKEDYDNGLIGLKAGKNEEALALFEGAQAKLLKITQQFPYNNDARLLILLILKQTSPSEYANQFAIKIASARSALANNTDLQSAYNDLKDLEALDPNYAGIKNLVYDFEIRLSLRRPPPDPVKIKRSDELTEQARPIVEKRQIDLFTVAKDLLNQALQLNPDNKRAKDFLDNMGIFAGQRTASAIDIQKFGQAQQLYLAKKHLEALPIINDLVSRNSGNREFVDLQKKIKAALGLL